jgi:integrase
LNSKQLSFLSPLAPHIEAYVAEKRGIGVKFVAEAGRLREIDRFVTANGFTDSVVTKVLFNAWSEKRPNEKESNRVLRVGTLQRFSGYLARMGFERYISAAKLNYHTKDFKAYIFTDDEIGRLLTAAHNIKYNAGSKVRYIVVPMLFTLLACTGLRIGEALALKRTDVTFDGGAAFVFVYSPKYDKDRRLPLAPKLSGKLRAYLTEISLKMPDSELMFPAPSGQQYNLCSAQSIFSKLLWSAGISYGGPGKGPRIHDLRHSYAVKALRKLAVNREDPQRTYPFLSKYLGHKNLSSTQGYIQLTAELFPYMVKTMEEYCGHIVPPLEAHNDKTY